MSLFSLGSFIRPFMRMRLFASARFKLVVGYVAALAIVLLPFSAALLWVVNHNLFSTLDERLSTQAEQMESLIGLEQEDLVFDKLDSLQLSELQNDSLRTLSVMMFNSEGEVRWQYARNVLPASPTLAETLYANEINLATINLPFERYRILTRPVTRSGELIGALQVGLSLRDIDEAISKLTLALLLTVPGALLAAGMGGWLLAARALRPIEESVARQRQFIQDASHELRTPLAIIQSNIDVSLQNPDVTAEKLKDKLRTIRDTSKRMGTIIEDLFTITTSDNQQLRLKPKRVALDKLMGDMCKQLRSLAKKKNQKLISEDFEQLEVFVDPDRLRQVVTILVDNAIKYTGEGGTITLSVNKTPGVDFAKISVADNGPGISKASQARIFERFYRVDKSRARTLGGNGLGLTIAQTLVEKSRGHISLQSKPGQGTRFDVFLPLVAKRDDTPFGLPRIFSRTPNRSPDAPKK